MGTNFWWLFDLAVIVITLFFIINCARRGFSKIVVTALGCAVSFAAALAVSQATSDVIYDKMFKKGNTNAVEKAVEEYHPEDVIKMIIEKNELSGVLSNENIKQILESKNSMDLLYDYANSKASNILDSKENFEKTIINEFALAFSSQIGENLPPYVAHEMLNHMQDNEKLFLTTVEMLIDNPDELPAFIEENYIRGPAKTIVKCAVFLIVFFVLMTVIIIVLNKTGKFGLLNGYDRLDKVAGGVMGCIEAAAAIMIIAFVVKIIINMSENDSSFISIQTIERTKIFKYFYDFI